MNAELKHFFYKGQSSDLTEHLRDKETYAFGLNGRVYMKDGTLAFVSAEGSEQVYNNPNIVRIMGSSVFKDRVILFAKATGLDVNVGGVIYETVSSKIVLAKNFEVDLVGGTFANATDFTDNTELVEYDEQITSPAPTPEVVIDDNYEPDGATNETVDYDSYYSVNINVPNFGACSFPETAIPVNNTVYSDSIWSIQINDQGLFVGTLLWAGYQNWPIDGKILTIGIEENSNFMRVKYADNVNPFRSINVYDPDLYRRSADELDNFQSTILLEPRIESIGVNGSLKSMAVQYYYRLITDNGQVTEFSPASKVQFIYPDETVFTGGAVSEVTNKSVTIVCNVVEPNNFAEIEVVSAEYESEGLPTRITTLGIQKVGEVNRFTHFGTESEFGIDVSIQDLIETKLSWKYCSDMESKNNKLFVSGLRGDPIDSKIQQLKYLMALHGWDDAGNTHDSFINSDPTLYNRIPVGLTDTLFFINKRVYRSVKIFQSATVTFKNVETSDEITLDIVGANNFYVDRTEEIANWLLDEQTNNVNFGTYFPNLTVDYTANVILLKPTNDLTETDFANYRLEYSQSQVLETIEDETIFKTIDVTGFPLVHGAMSAGFNTGTGVRLSYRLIDEELATQATDDFDGTNPIIDITEPTFNKTFIKDEIYRLGIQLYQNGQRLFAIPLGDIKIPDLGEYYSYINDDGNSVITSDRYVNQKTIGNKLYGVRVELHVEVRLDCDYSKDIDMYQLLYVERTEQNRTVLCQGLSAPLLRVQDPTAYLAGTTNAYPFDEKLQAKWMLPYFGGPTYDATGLAEYDLYGGERNAQSYVAAERVIHDRSLIYFDAPDHIYGLVSDALISSAKLKVIGKVNTDHTPEVIMESGDKDTVTGDGQSVDMDVIYGGEVYPKFSRKIRDPQLRINVSGVADDLPRFTWDENFSAFTIQTHFINFSVFANFNHPLNNDEHLIDGAVELNPGEVVPGTDLNTSFDLSNNAMCLPSMPWWFSRSIRNIDVASDQHRNEGMFASRASIGQKTLFIRSATDIFTNDMVGPVTIPTIDSQIRAGEVQTGVHDTHLIVNLKRTNENSVYGGRTELAYSQNRFIPIGETKPVLNTNNGSQAFQIQGDSYVTLYLRTKNSKNIDGNEFERENSGTRDLNNGRSTGNSNDGDIQRLYLLEGAWCYGVVLETSIEPKLNNEYEFYRETQAIDFYQIKSETLNGAYLKQNNAKSYLTEPLRFQDDPLYTNIIAASETKLNGEYYDAWASFPVNEFQELDKNMGACFNLAKWKDEIFAIQERQTNLLQIDRDVMINSDSGQINLKQGAGKSIDGYKVISPYGTSLRRSVVKHSQYGFGFIDERQNKLIKYDRPILIENKYHHDFFDSLDKNPAIEVEAFFNPKYEESCWQITQKNGDVNVISYNEALQALNGYYSWNTPHYITWNDKLLAFAQNITVVGQNTIYESNSLHRFNFGKHLSYFGKSENMTLSFISTAGPNIISIFKHISMILGENTQPSYIKIETKEGAQRLITPNHSQYKIREGIHSVPLLNDWTENIEEKELYPIRSEFVKITLTFPYTGNEQKIISAVTHIRQSII